MSFDDSDLDDLARSAGAMVLGEPGSVQQYLLSLDDLARLVALLVPPCPCPVPLPAVKSDSAD